MDYNLPQRLDAFVRGDCSLGVFLQELFVLCDSSPDSAWEVLSLVDQYYRRGKLSADEFRTVKLRVELHVLGVPDSETVRELANGAADTEALVGAARGSAGALVCTRETAVSPGEPQSDVRALPVSLPNGHRSPDRLRALLVASGRWTRSALANTQRLLGVGRTHAEHLLGRLTAFEYRGFVREHFNPEIARPCVAAVVLAAVLLGIESSPLPKDLPAHRVSHGLISPAAAAAVVLIPPVADPGQISLSAERYLVFPGHANAEIEVHRTAGVRGDVSFVWWTQRSGGTKPGRDYVARRPQMALLRDGVDTLQLSLPIVANPLRKHTELFYVLIGKPGGGASLGSIRRAAVFIMRPD